MNLAEIRILFVHDMGTSVEGLQPCRLFPAEGEPVCVCVCWRHIYTAFMYRENLRGSQSVGIYVSKGVRDFL